MGLGSREKAGELTVPPRRARSALNAAAVSRPRRRQARLADTGSPLRATAASVGRQPRFGQALRDPLDVLFSIERESADMAGERVARIDRFEFVPEAPRFFDNADMTEGGGEERP